MKLFLDTALIHRIFDDRFGGIANFADDWTERGEPRTVSTIYAWLKNGLPTQRDTVFSFFGALGVDPIAVIDLDRSKLPKNFGRLRTAFMLGGVNAGGFGPLFELYRPSAGWPDEDLLQRHFNRQWTLFEFGHAAEDIKNTYATLTVRGHASEPPDWPRAYHIAYRRRSNADGLWRPYGTVASRAKEAILVHENGDIQQESMPVQSCHQLRFKTYFGPSPVEFRLASMHPFSFHMDPEDDPAVPLRFEG